MELNKYFFEVLRNRLENILRPLSGNYKARIVYGDTTATDIKNTVILSARNEIIPGKTPSLAELYLSYKGSTAHEGGHIRYTSLSAWQTASSKGPIFQHLTNIIEDGRIETLISERLPGAGKWIRFKNNYIYDNRPPEHYGKGLNAFLGGLIIYSVLQKIPAFLPPDVINIVKLAAPYVDIGKAASCTEDVLPQVEAIMAMPEVQELISKASPPNMLPDTGSSKPEKASSQKAQERAEKAEKIIKIRLKKAKEESEKENKPRAESKPEDPEESKPEETQSSKTDSEKPEESELSEKNVSNEESQSSKPNESEESKGSEESGSPNEKNDAGSETTSGSDESDESEVGSGELENTDSGDTDANSEGESGTNPGDSDSETLDNEGSEEKSDDTAPGSEDESGDSGETDSDTDSENNSEGPENPEDPEADSNDPGSEDAESNLDDDESDSDNDHGESDSDHDEREEDNQETGTGQGNDSDDSSNSSSEDSPSSDSTVRGAPGDPGNKENNPGEDDFFDGPEDDFFDEPEEEDFQELVESLEEEVSTLTEEAKEIEEDAREIDPLQGINKYYAGFQIREISKNPQQYQKLKKQNQILIKNLVQEIEIAIETRKAYDLRGLNRGRLNSSSLWKLAVPDPSIFSRRIIPGDIPELAAYILVDCSGSMSNRTNGIIRIDAVKNAACVLSEACRTLKIPHAVTGFDDCGRSTYHYPAVTWDDGDSSKIPSLHASVANRDGFSIRIAANELNLRQEPRKILFVLSDGQPATNNYHGKSALNDVKNAVIETKKKGMQVISLFFGTNDLIPDFRYMYDTPVFVNNINFLPRTLGEVFKKVLLQ